MLSLLFLGVHGAHISSVPPCTALGAARRGVPHFAHGNLTLQIDHVVAVKKAEGVELELGHILLAGVEIDIGLVFNAPLLDQFVLDSSKIMGIWRSHTGVHKEPEVGIRTVEGGLEEDLFLLAGIVWRHAPLILGLRRQEE